MKHSQSAVDRVWLRRIDVEMFKRIRSYLNRLPYLFVESHTTGPIVLAIATGIAAGLVAVTFRMLIGAAQDGFFGGFGHLYGFIGRYYMIIVPAAGGLIAGPLIYYFAKEAKGHGVPEVMEAVALHGGRIRPIVAIIKSVASAITIGSGGSVGREGPIVQVGSTIGSTIGQVLKLPEQRVRILVASGAAGGISAVFGAPIAGVLFALEVILGEFSARAFGLVVLASVSANIVARSFQGDAPAYAVPAYSFKSAAEMPLYLVLGIFAAVVALTFVRLLYKLEEVFDGWKIPEWVKPAVGGLMIGVIGLFYFGSPEHPLGLGPLGMGHEPMEMALGGDMPLRLMLILIGAKLAATTITLGSGASGGVFAPSLFMGSMLGGAFGMIANRLFPNVVASSGSYSVVGMAAVFGGAAHAPMTAILIVFEMTNDYRIILPLMTAVVTSTLISQWLSRDSIYTLKLRHKGIDLSVSKRINLMETIVVAEAMTRNFDTVRDNTPVPELVRRFTDTGHHGFPVLDENGNLVGMVTLSDVEQAVVDQDPQELLVKDIMTRSLLTTYPDETLEEALRRFGVKDVGRLPVVDRGTPEKIIGLLRRGDIISAYSQAALEHREVLARVDRMKVETGPDIRFVEIDIKSSSRPVNKQVKELVLPKQAILVSIRRNGRILIPHGTTRIRPGDRIVALTKRSDQQSLMKVLGE